MLVVGWAWHAFVFPAAFDHHARGLPGSPLDRPSTRIALDMLGHYASTDKVFYTPGWSKGGDGSPPG
jgi:hypothetical protein